MTVNLRRSTRAMIEGSPAAKEAYAFIEWLHTERYTDYTIDCHIRRLLFVMPGVSAVCARRGACPRTSGWARHAAHLSRRAPASSTALVECRAAAAIDRSREPQRLARPMHPSSDRLLRCATERGRRAVPGFDRLGASDPTCLSVQDAVLFDTAARCTLTATTTAVSKTWTQWCRWSVADALSGDIFRKRMREAGLPDCAKHVYRLRHTFAMRLLLLYR